MMLNKMVQRCTVQYGGQQREGNVNSKLFVEIEMICRFDVNATRTPFGSFVLTVGTEYQCK